MSLGLLHLRDCERFQFSQVKRCNLSNSKALIDDRGQDVSSASSSAASHLQLKCTLMRNDAGGVMPYSMRGRYPK